jgi:plastocyanin domain-containing protein
MKRSVLALAVVVLAAACSRDKEKEQAAKPAAAAAAAGGEQLVEISVTEDGYIPKEVVVEKGRPVHMRVTRKTDKTCATEVVLAEHDIDVKLPLGQPVDIVFTPTKSGELRYGCAMDHMISSVITVR